LDQVRQRVQRVLRELGGNSAEVRTEFVKDALAEAAKHGLRLPKVADGEGHQQRLVGSMHQSLRNLLNGKGQTDWMLDIWELSCALLEMPVGRAGLPAHLSDEPIIARHQPLVVAPAQPLGKPADGYRRSGPTVGVQPFAEEAAAAKAGPTGATVAQHNDEDDVLRTEVAGARDAALLGRAVAVEAAAASLAEALAEAPGLLAAERKRYLGQLQEAALAGDEWAANRLEKLLGL
jgi:hypothetical protein